MENCVGGMKQVHGGVRPYSTTYGVWVGTPKASGPVCRHLFVDNMRYSVNNVDHRCHTPACMNLMLTPNISCFPLTDPLRGIYSLYGAGAGSALSSVTTIIPAVAPSKRPQHRAGSAFPRKISRHGGR